MLRNYFITALRNLIRNKLYAAINVLGLAMGFAAAILIFLFVRDELSFDRWIPGYQQIYKLETFQLNAGEKPRRRGFSVTNAAGFMKLDYPAIESVTRMTPSASALRAGAIDGSDRVMWSDANLFTVLPMPVIAGNLQTALATPDSVVLTRSMARKYFGSDVPLGKALEINPGMSNLPNLPAAEAQALGSFHIMRVTAVIEDLPSNTHLNAQIFAAATAAFSPMQHWDTSVGSAEVLAYVRLKPDATANAITDDLNSFASRHYASSNGRTPGWAFELVPLSKVHLQPTVAGAMKPSGDLTIIIAIAMIGVLIVLIATINFVTLVTARATRRALEVGVRKAVGARRFDLTTQFMGETLIYVILSMLCALALAEIALPYANAFLQRELQLNYLHDLPLMAALIGATLIVGLLAGVYPSLVLSAFRPASVLKNVVRGSKAAGVRQALVVFQFAVIVVLVIVTHTLYRQTRFALHDSLAIDTDQVLSIYTPCSDSFKQQVQALPGVKAVACTSSMALNGRPTPTLVSLTDGSQRTTQGAPVDVGFLELQGLQPVAGRFFDRTHGIDLVLQTASSKDEAQPSVIINQRAVQALGYASAQAAIGQNVNWGRYDPSLPRNAQPPLRVSQIVGVVQDFTLGSIRTPMEPTLYYVDPKVMLFTAVKLNGRDVTGTLAAIDKLLKRIAPDNPIQRTFETQTLQNLYIDVTTQSTVIAVCASLAVSIGCLGLFGLAAFTAERRTKEIGIRKALGAGTREVLRLLIWQFTKPVVWATLLAWPVAAVLANRWLQGFAYHIALSPWLFVSAAMLALLIALLTVSTHCYQVARARPVTALRYE
ncbi:MAG: ABC transporter permease [Steroidobacteraceae bacterium]